MRRILITGAGPNGFVGRNLRESAEGYEVYAPPSRELDVTSAEDVACYVRQRGIETVIHSAVHNPRTRGSEDENKNNLLMFEAFERLSGELDKIIYFGSGAEFDKRLPLDMVTEEEIGRSLPADTYGSFKYELNLRARASRNIYNLRLFGIYGKYEYWPLKFISNLCCKAVFGLPLNIRRNCLFDFLYIDDLWDAVRWFIENEPKHHDYNIVQGVPVSLTEIAEAVKRASGKDLPVIIAEEGFNLPYTASSSRMNAEYNFKRRSLDEAVRELYEYYSSVKDDIDYEVLKQSR